MGIFKNIFGTSEQPGQPTPIQSNRTILDLIKMDCKSLPDDTFKVYQKKITDSGTLIVTYRKELPYKECGIFDIIEVHKGES